MESLGFVLMYFLRGSLPWQGLKANTKKKSTTESLSTGKRHTQSNCAKDFFAHCSSLGFEDRPDNRYLKRAFKDLFERLGFEDDGIFDWDILKKQKEQAGGAGGGGPFIMPAAGLEGGEDGDVDIDGRKAGAAAGAELDGGIGGVTSQASARGGAAQTMSGKAGDEASHSRLDDSGDPRDAGGTRRSIISSIRHSLLGSRIASRADGGGNSVSDTNRGLR